MDDWSKGVLTGLAIGVVFVGLTYWQGRQSVRDAEQTLTATILQQRADVLRLQSENTRCAQQLQASAARQIQLELAVRQYQQQIQQGQVPTELLSLLAKILL